VEVDVYRRVRRRILALEEADGSGCGEAEARGTCRLPGTRAAGRAAVGLGRSVCVPQVPVRGACGGRHAWEIYTGYNRAGSPGLVVGGGRRGRKLGVQIGVVVRRGLSRTRGRISRFRGTRTGMRSLISRRWSRRRRCSRRRCANQRREFSAHRRKSVPCLSGTKLMTRGFADAL
jgi:hypothetical protein